jgi:hypothetical protein
MLYVVFPSLQFLHFCAGNNGDTDGMYRKYVAGQAIALFKGTEHVINFLKFVHQFTYVLLSRGLWRRL